MKIRTAALSICLMVFAAVCPVQAALVQHLDATVSSSVSGDPVTQWSDQSGSANHAVNADGSVSYPSTSLSETGLAGLDFGTTRNSLQLFSDTGSDSWLNQTSGNGFCALVAFKCDGLTGNWSDLIGNSTATGSGFGLRYSSSGAIQAYLGGVTINKGGTSIAAGDTVVLGFNYKSTDGSIELWDSINLDSAATSVAAADFSLAQAVRLGSTTASTRYMDGMVGEVKFFDAALSASEFQSERDALAQKWAGIEPPLAVDWRVIAEDANYPTDDVILAAVSIDDGGYTNPLPADPSTQDCTATFQEALDLAAAEGGGTVFVPAGEYRIDGPLNLSDNVVLRGRWSEITATQPASGTILKLYATGTNAVITLSGIGSGVRDLTFWHPEQIPHASNPVDYPYIIYGEGKKTTIENITMVNAYNGIDMSRSSMCCVRGVYGSPLNTGLTADQSYSVSRYDRIHFSPDYWAWSGLAASPAVNGAHATYMRTYGSAVDIREMDGFYFLFSTISGYNKGIVYRDGIKPDDPWGSMAYITISNCTHALHVENSKSIKIVGCTFKGSDYGIYGGDDSSIDLILNGCTIEGGINSVSLLNGAAHMVNCALTGSTSAAAAAKLTEVSSATPLPAFNNVYDKTRKPLKTDLFNVKDYGAVGDRVTDDTAAIQAAVAAAVANGGGIVLVPDGEYLMRGNLDLGVGVEFRGNNGGRHESDYAGELGSLILIDIGKNQPEGTPFITMGDYSGLRGISFFYPDQNYTDDMAYDAYPYMVQANGIKNYLIDCFAGNAYQGVELNGDDHLVEYTFIGGLRRTYRANNCSGGRIQNLHIKSGFWRDAGWPGNPSENNNMGPFKWDVGAELQAIYINGCTDYAIMSVFNHASHDFVTIDNSSGQALMVATERVQHGVTVKNGSKPFDFILTGATVNDIGDYSGQYGFKTLPGYTGTARFFTGYHWGVSEDSWAAEDGHLYLQQCHIGGFKTKGANNFITSASGELTLDACKADVFLGIDNAGTLNMADCDFNSGLLNSVYPAYGADNQASEVYILADLNHDPARAYGIEADTNNIVFVDAPQSIPDVLFPVEGDARRHESATLSSGTSFLLDVNDPEFSSGAKPNVTFEVLVMVSNVSATVDVYYDNGGANLKLGNSTAVDATVDVIKWKTITFSVSDAYFGAADNVDIRVETTAPSSTILDMVAVSSTDLPSSVDTLPPTPNPMSWAVAPHAISSTEIAMTATTASDPSGPVEYQFWVRDEVAAANAALVWQSDVNFTASGLSPNTEYNIRVRARDSLSNTGSFSDAVYVTTDAANQAPAFTADPIVEANGTEGAAYSATLADDASDPESDPMTFSLVSAPSWLSVASDGTLSGTPGAGDVGLNSFTVQVDAIGGSDSAVLEITVDAAADTTPPAAPTGLSALAGIGSVDLDWSDNAEGDLAGYTVYRSTTSGSGYGAIASGLTASDYADSAAANHTTYYYVVTATDTSANESVQSSEISAQPGWVSDNPSSDISVSGSVSGMLADAETNDDLYQTITEINDGTTSALEHKWLFDVTGAELVTFYVEAHHSANGEGDDFVFACSTNDVDYIDMVTVTKTADDNMAQFYALPSGLSGTVYVRVLDTDRTPGSLQLDSISVDAIVITSEESSAAPSAASAPVPADGAADVAVTADLSWTAGLMAASHDVYFGTSPSPVFQGNQAGTVFDPGTLLNSTTYYWAVDAVNNSGTTAGPVWSFTTEAAAPAGWAGLAFDDFESGMGDWVDGGTDVKLSSSYAMGTQCVYIRDDSGDGSSIWLVNPLDLSGAAELKIEFTFMPIGMDNGEGFRVQFSDDGGSSWTTIKAYVVNTDFTNDVREYPELIIDSGSYNFTSNVKIRFECNASSNKDEIYIDDVRVSAQ